MDVQVTPPAEALFLSATLFFFVSLQFDPIFAFSAGVKVENREFTH